MCHLTKGITKAIFRIPNRTIKGIKGLVASTTIKGRVTNTTIIKEIFDRTKVKDKILVNSTSDHNGVWMTWSMIW